MLRLAGPIFVGTLCATGVARAEAFCFSEKSAFIDAFRTDMEKYNYSTDPNADFDISDYWTIGAGAYASLAEYKRVWTKSDAAAFLVTDDLLACVRKNVTPSYDPAELEMAIEYFDQMFPPDVQTNLRTEAAAK